MWGLGAVWPPITTSWNFLTVLLLSQVRGAEGIAREKTLAIFRAE